MHVRDRAFNDRRYFIDCSKLLALGWSEQKSWQVGLTDTIDWYATQDLSSYWGNFESALHPHPTPFGHRDAFTPSVGVEFDQFPENTPKLSHNESNATFLIYGKTGWIGGMLGKLLANTNHAYFMVPRDSTIGAIEEDIDQQCRRHFERRDYRPERRLVRNA